MPVNILESFKKAQAGYPDDLTEEDEALLATPLTGEVVDDIGKEDEHKRNAKRLGEISQEILAKIVPEGTEPTLAMREHAVKQAMEQLHKENKQTSSQSFMNSDDSAIQSDPPEIDPYFKRVGDFSREVRKRFNLAPEEWREDLTMHGDGRSSHKFTDHMGNEHTFGLNADGSFGHSRKLKDVNGKGNDLFTDFVEYNPDWTVRLSPNELSTASSSEPKEQSKLGKLKSLLSLKKSEDDDTKESIIQKSTSQLMAERYAQGVPTGAYAKNVPQSKETD